MMRVFLFTLIYEDFKPAFDYLLPKREQEYRRESNNYYQITPITFKISNQEK